MSKIIHSTIKTPAVTPACHKEPGKRIPLVKNMWQTGQWLSLDVALGAVLSCIMVCRLMNVAPIPWVQVLILGGVVLLIYTLDHLWDVRHMRKVPITARHFFHWRFEQELWWFAGILFCILCVAAVLALSQEVFYFGLILGCTVIMYLWLVNNLPANKANQWFLKEIYVALIYTAGIWGSVWVQAGCVKPVQWVLAMLFGITALLNLLIFSYYELEEDRIQSQRSVVIAWGKSKVNAGCVWLFILFGVTALLLACSHLQKTEQRVLLIECLMAAILLLLFVFPAFFSKEYRYRWIGDGIFLLPGFALF